MSSSTPYKPFLISEFKSGLFNYLEPWIRPVEAFDPLSNAFIYRGTLNKRSGFTTFGRMAYCDNGIQIAVGDGGVNYSGTLATFPIRAGSFTATNGVESFTDNGLGVLTGSAGGSGTINYTTGAWTLIFNAAVGGGVIIRAGYTYIPTRTTTPAPLARPIMGLKQWVDESTNQRKLLAMDTRRASVYNDSTKVFDPLCSVSQQLWQGDAVTVAITIATGWVAVAPYTQGIAPYSVSVTDGTSTIVDDGIGNLSAAGNFAAGGTVNYATGAIGLAFAVAPATTVSITATFDLVGDYFTGTNSNFFNAINWLGLMYMVNNVDRITRYNGLDLDRPPFPITQANRITFTNDILTCLDIDVYKNRLLVQRPLVASPNSAPSDNQSIRFSAIQNPTNLVADVAGNGGETSAPTDDFIQSSEFLRDQLIVGFTNSTWTFRFTGSAFDPFRWDKINNTKSVNAPYGTIPYDERITMMGSKGLLACDGVNVQRYDTQIIDQFLEINQSRFFQCFGQRFDSLNQTWMLFPEEPNTELSNKVLVYNFIENVWSVYDILLSCLGLYFTTEDVTWDDFAVGQPMQSTWEQAEFQWNSYLLQDNSPTLLGGGQTGIVYQMNQGDVDNPDDTNPAETDVPYNCSITSTRWNPFLTLGQKVQFGYIDFYYQINEEAVLTLDFFGDNSSAPYTTRTLTLDGPNTSDVHTKRIYININSQFLRMNISSSSEAVFKIIGMILWASPSGRWTPK